MIHGIYIYLILNSIVLGSYLDELDGLWITIIMSIVLFFIGFPLFMLAVIPNSFTWACKKLDNQLQVSFFFTYLFSKKLHNMDTEALKSINRISANVRNTNSLKDRIYRYGTRLINKRNNFNPDSAIENKGDF